MSSLGLRGDGAGGLRGDARRRLESSAAFGAEWGITAGGGLPARTAATAIRVWIAIHAESFASGYAIYIMSASVM